MNTFYNLHYFNFFDAPTIAIMIPTMVLAFLILVCGIKKHYWVLRPADVSINAAESGQRSTDDGRIAFAIKRLDVYFYGLVLVNALANFFLSTMNYAISPGDTFHTYFIRHLVAMASAVFFSLLGTVSLFAVVHAVRLRRGMFIPAVSPSHPARFVFSCMAFIFLALWTIPIIQAILVASFSLPGDLYLLKDLARICIAFSTIPLALMGVMVAFTSNSSFACERAKQRLHLQSLSPECLSALEEERLHKIADDARLAQNFEAAEIVSLHLLERAEASVKAS